ncbi:peptidase inhibitor family I36 protein (plasmid) [Streptomyces sp. NBC_01450]|uniref:peptidase inhibitor family I36 protein n=1 Tax=Streptomyces sp. NBC_01450 TaxID=2903871 RepID=UPI002E32B905|nr:peptidase inhibitor family I36 protein [Streptomyces sp. NBC_01450]
MKLALGRTAVALGVTAAALTTTLGVGGSADAATGYLRLCLDINAGRCSDFTAVSDNFYVKDPVNTYGNHTWQDSISSLYNYSTRNVCFYTDNNFQGSSITLPPGYRIDDVSYWNMNDAISSWKSC